MVHITGKAKISKTLGFLKMRGIVSRDCLEAGSFNFIDLNYFIHFIKQFKSMDFTRRTVYAVFWHRILKISASQADLRFIHGYEIYSSPKKLKFRRKSSNFQNCGFLKTSLGDPGALQRAGRAMIRSILWRRLTNLKAGKQLGTRCIPPHTEFCGEF